MKYCPKCGAQAAEEAVSCPKCGFPFSSAKTNKKTWGDVLGGIGLGLSIFALVFGLLALIPLLGLVFFWIAIIPGSLGLGLCIAGCIKAVGKGKCITGIIIASLAIAFASLGWILLLSAAAVA